MAAPSNSALVRDKDSCRPYPWQERRGRQVCQYALNQGVLLRPLGDVIYFMPPYVINAEEIELMTRTAWYGIQQVCGA
ncbi:MAG: hypothetical protein ACE5ET_09180 [Gammaproteobacteria bacterium]